MGMKRLAALVVALMMCMTAAGALAATVATVSGAIDPVTKELDTAINKGYETLQDAFEAVASKYPLGYVTITLTPNTTIKSNGNTAELVQSKGTYITIKGDGNTTVVSSQIKIVGNLNEARDQNCSVTVEDVIFDGTGIADNGNYMLGNNARNSDIHNLTVENCKFIDDNKSVCGIKMQQGMGKTTIKNCTAENMHCLFWGQGGTMNLEFDKVTVNNCKEGIHAGSGSISTVEIKNSKFSVDGFVIRTDLTNDYNSSLRLNNNTMDTVTPIVIRGYGSAIIDNTKTHELDISDNTYTALTAEQAGQVISYEEGAVTPDVVDGEETAQDVANNKFLNPAAYNSYVDFPQTGDNSSLMLWASMLALAAMGFVATRKTRLN